MSTYIVVASERIRVELGKLFPASSGVSVITPEFSIPDDAANTAVILPPDILTSNAASVEAFDTAVAAMLDGTDINQLWLGTSWSDGDANDQRTLMQAEIDALTPP